MSHIVRYVIIYFIDFQQVPKPFNLLNSINDNFNSPAG